MPTDRPNPIRTPGSAAYLIGIGGCGMSGLAEMLRARGLSVAGSDHARSEVTDRLTRLGVPVSFDQEAGELPERADVVVASAAIKADHPELVAAVERGVWTVSYAEALGACMADHTGVAVAGTHGKSTTVAMLGAALIEAGLDPTVIVGASVPDLAGAGEPATGFRLGAGSIPSGERAGGPGLLLAEACEFNRSFHHLRPALAAITSVEADHLDVYGSLDAVVRAFAEFAALLPSGSDGGTLLIAHEGAHRREIAAATAADVETVGFTPSADWCVEFDPTPRRVMLHRAGERVCDFTLRAPGAHMAVDAAFAAALAIRLGADPLTVARGLERFRGVDRRMQLLARAALPGVPAGAPTVAVYDDYGHHPTEVDATLRALRDAERPQDRGGKLVCVFQPHQHSRTRFLLDEFADAFSHADAVIVPHIYFVRDSEAERTRVSAADLVDRLRDRGVRAMHLYPFGAIVEQLENLVKPGDVLVAMGAGPVWQVARGFLDSLARGAPAATSRDPSNPEHRSL